MRFSSLFDTKQRFEEANVIGVSSSAHCALCEASVWPSYQRFSQHVKWERWSVHTRIQHHCLGQSLEKVAGRTKHIFIGSTYPTQKGGAQECVAHKRHRSLWLSESVNSGALSVSSTKTSSSKASSTSQASNTREEQCRLWASCGEVAIPSDFAPWIGFWFE